LENTNNINTASKIAREINIMHVVTDGDKTNALFTANPNLITNLFANDQFKNKLMPVIAEQLGIDSR